MPRGALAQYLLALLGQKRTSLYISREKTIIISSKHGATIFFPITIFFYENLKKNWPKSARKYWASISDRAHAPWE